MCVGTVAKVDIIKRIVGLRMVKVEKVAKVVKVKEGQRMVRVLTQLMFKTPLNQRLSQSYLELAMVERTDMPARAKARANPVLEVPDDFPDVGVSEIVRRLAYQRDVRLTNQGYARGSRPNWREEPVTRYRQRSMAFSEASRMKGSMREVTIKKITEAEGIDQSLQLM